VLEAGQSSAYAHAAASARSAAAPQLGPFGSVASLCRHVKANASSPGLVEAFSTIMGESYLVT
jgi:hypothetical protein